MSQTLVLPPLNLDGWRATRDILWGYARCLGAIRRVLSPPARHWSHISLVVGSRGLTTGPMMVAGERFEVRLDLRRAQIVFDSESGQVWAGGLPGTSAREILDRARSWLSRSGDTTLDDLEVAEIENLEAFDQRAAERYWVALSRIEFILSEFSSTLQGESYGPQLWPHHFDLAVLWLSGRSVSNAEPGDEGASEESMNFGFSTGDKGIPQAYVYATAYPPVVELTSLALPGGGRWHSQGWQGAVLDYSGLVRAENPGELLLSFLTTVQQAGAAAMRERASSE